MPADEVLVRRIYLGAAAEAVWPWLVEPEKSARYHLGDLVFPLACPGDPVQYLSKAGGHLMIDGVVEEILEGRKLVHTFQFQADEPEPAGRVTYELVRYGDAMCRLDLSHEGIVPGSETDAAMGSGWDIILSSLKTLIETGRPLPWPSRRRGGSVQ